MVGIQSLLMNYKKHSPTYEIAVKVSYDQMPKRRRSPIPIKRCDTTRDRLHNSKRVERAIRCLETSKKR